MSPPRTSLGRSKRSGKDALRRLPTTSAASLNTSSSRGPSLISAERSRDDTQPHRIVSDSSHGNSRKPPTRLYSEPVATKKKPNVFDFLDDDGGHNGTSPSNVHWPEWMDSCGQPSSTASERSTTSHISSASMDTSPGMIKLQLSKTGARRRKSSIERTCDTEDLASRCDWEQPAEMYYSSPKITAAMSRQPFPPSPPDSPEEAPRKMSRVSQKDSSPLQVSSGYGFLASHLSTPAAGTHHAPLYRRFGSLNHRVLLYLQDEISQMEEHLQLLDEYEEAHRAAAAVHQGTKVMPASRRMDVHAQAYSPLHFRRQDLIGLLIQRTEQYNNALTAYNKALHTLPQASANDIRNYRAWLKEHSPIAASETHFLDHDDDLVSIPPSLHPSTSFYATFAIASAAIFMPLLTFGMISELSGRLIIVTLIGGISSIIAANYSTGLERLIDSRDGWKCAAVYFIFMATAAIFIP